MCGKTAQSAIQEAERKYAGIIYIYIIVLQVAVHGEKNVKVLGSALLTHVISEEVPLS